MGGDMSPGKIALALAGSLVVATAVEIEYGCGPVPDVFYQGQYECYGEGQCYCMGHTACREMLDDFCGDGWRTVFICQTQGDGMFRCECVTKEEEV